MLKLLLRCLRSAIRSRQSLIFENAALRHQIEVLQRNASRPRLRWPGRPRVSREVRDLIRQMSQANSLWGAPRIHGELLKLGIEVSQATVSKNMVKLEHPPSQTWRTFLANHAKDIVSIDFFTVPTAPNLRLLRGRGNRSSRRFRGTRHPGI